MSLDQANQEADAPVVAAGSKRTPAWRAELNDNYCKLRKVEQPP